MKKILSIVLVLALVLSLGLMVACSSEKETTDAGAGDAGTPVAGDTGATDLKGTQGTGAMEAPEGETEAEKAERLKNSKPNEYVQEKLDAGMEVLVGFMVPTIADEMMLEICEGLTADMAELGITVNYTSPGDDTGTAYELTENYIQMGCAAVGMIPADASALIDLMNQGLELGCYVVFLGTVPEFDYVGAANVNVIDSANACFDMAKAWIEQNPQCVAEDGKVHVAVTGRVNNTDNKKRSEQMKIRAEEDDTMVMAFWDENTNTVEQGYNTAESAMSVDSEIRVFLDFSTSATVGISQYIMSQPQYAAVKDEFGAFAMGNNGTLQTMVDEAANGGDSICRGMIKQGGEKSWSGIMDVITGLLIDGAEIPYTIYEHMWSYCYIDGYEYDNGL